MHLWSACTPQSWQSLRRPKTGEHHGIFNTIFSRDQRCGCFEPKRQANGGSGGSVIARPASGFSDPRAVGLAERMIAAAIADADRVDEPGGRSAYHFGFSVELRTRCTTDWDIRKVRAMAAGLTPALNDARMRFAVPSGIL